METERCFACGATVPKTDGPVHRYLKSSPGCWAVYGDVLAREYTDAAYFTVHRLTVDAYAVQHPGSTDRQSVHSVGTHLIRLYLVLECGLMPGHADAVLGEAIKQKHSFVFLAPPQDPGAITVADVRRAASAEEHSTLVHSWARCAWQAWSMHWQTIRSWVPAPALDRISS